MRQKGAFSYSGQGEKCIIIIIVVVHQRKDFKHFKKGKKNQAAWFTDDSKQEGFIRIKMEPINLFTDVLKIICISFTIIKNKFK